MPEGAHIAVVSPPAPGHINPSLGIIAELVARGHRVTYVNTEPFAAEAKALGAYFAPYTSTLPIANGQPPASGDEIDAISLSVQESINVLPQLGETFVPDRPDLVVYDIAVGAGRVLADKLGIPAVQLSPSVVPSRNQYEVMVDRLSRARETPRGAALYDKVADWLAENHCTDGDPVRYLLAQADRTLVLVPRVMQPEGGMVDEATYTFVGPCTVDRAEESDWERPTSADKVLLVSLGSLFTDRLDFYRQCLAAAAHLSAWHVVVQVGNHIRLADLGDIPGNVEVHRWVPQVAVLARSDVFVTHAGMSSCAEGLRSRTPMIVVPQGAEQAGNAARLLELGVARDVPARTDDASALQAALQALLADDRVPDRLRRISDSIRNEGGAVRAAELIESSLLGTTATS